MHKTKAIIFDMDGTLVDTEIIWYLAWKEANEHFGLGLSDETMKTFIGLPNKRLMKIEPISLKKIPTLMKFPNIV